MALPKGKYFVISTDSTLDFENDIKAELYCGKFTLNSYERIISDGFEKYVHKIEVEEDIVLIPNQSELDDTIAIMDIKKDCERLCSSYEFNLK